MKVMMMYIGRGVLPLNCDGYTLDEEDRDEMENLEQYYFCIG